MRSRMTEPGRWMLAVVLVGSLLAMFAGALPVVADDPPDPVRTLPATVAPGEEFEVTVTFTAPCGEYTAEFEDTAPAGWIVSVDATWCTPEPEEAVIEGPTVYYSWSTPQSDGTPYTAVYKVEVPVDAEPGEYGFSGAFLGHCDGQEEPQPIGGDATVTVSANGNGDSGQVDLRAYTPPETGSIELIKLFDPGEAEYPEDQIEVRVTGPNEFEETYTLTRDDGWEKIIDGLALGTYSVQEVDPAPPWIPSYDPESRQLTVVSGDEPGADAIMTITNIYSVIGISVAPEEIEFGEINAGVTKTVDPITVTNTGTLNIDVDAELTADTAYNDDGHLLYTKALRLAGLPSDKADAPTEFGSWTATDLGLVNVAPTDSPEVTTALICPAEMHPDTEYTGTLVFWAVESDG